MRIGMDKIKQSRLFVQIQFALYILQRTKDITRLRRFRNYVDP